MPVNPSSGTRAGRRRKQPRRDRRGAHKVALQGPLSAGRVGVAVTKKLWASRLRFPSSPPDAPGHPRDALWVPPRALGAPLWVVFSSCGRNSDTSLRRPRASRDRRSRRGTRGRSAAAPTQLLRRPNRRCSMCTTRFCSTAPLCRLYQSLPRRGPRALRPNRPFLSRARYPGNPKDELTLALKDPQSLIPKNSHSPPRASSRIDATRIIQRRATRCGGAFAWEGVVLKTAGSTYRFSRQHERGVRSKHWAKVKPRFNLLVRLERRRPFDIHSILSIFTGGVFVGFEAVLATARARPGNAAREVALCAGAPRVTQRSSPPARLCALPCIAHGAKRRLCADNLCFERRDDALDGVHAPRRRSNTAFLELLERQRAVPRGSGANAEGWWRVTNVPSTT